MHIQCICRKKNIGFRALERTRNAKIGHKNSVNSVQNVIENSAWEGQSRN